MLSAVRGCRAALRTGEPPWTSLEDGPAQNERLLAATPERDPKEVADLLVTESRAYRDEALASPDETGVWNGGIEVPLAVIAGIEAGDALIHGWDIAATIGRSWPIERRDAILVGLSAMEIIPHFVDRSAAAGFSATYGLHLRGGPDVTMVFDDGALTTSDGRPGRADCRISADPEAYLLSAYGRTPPWKVALTGKMAAYGRRPWLAFKLGTLLRSP
ncbi:MAG TPA: SCP2 sterol-binding domain-containing protein [Acidimicrobiales bacterium]|nr:SCP2 sterol-binding domain-containing protein [Acidimicrobiales bacterium]